MVIVEHAHWTLFISVWLRFVRSTLFRRGLDVRVASNANMYILVVHHKIILAKCVCMCVCVVDFGKCLHILNDASHTQTEATSRFSKIQSNRQRFHNVHNHQLNQLSYRLKSSFDLFKVHTEGDRERERGREKIASIWRAFQKLIRIHFIYIYKYMHASMYVRSCYFL